ncbi:MAG: DNA-binding domain-containing protein [Luteimonas sp.]
MNACLYDAAAGALLDPRCMPTSLSTDDAFRFDVHRNTMMTTLVSALAEGAPVTHAVVGDAFFHAMAQARVRADPPRSPVLVEYLDGFGDFIDLHPPAAALPWLPDLARLEALRVQSHHARDALALSPAVWADLLQGEPEALAGLSVTLHPACRWLRSTHAVGSVWMAHQCDDINHAVSAIDLDVAEDVLVVRPDLDVHVQVLPPGGWALLEALAARRTLGEAFAFAGEDADDMDPSALFTLLVGEALAVAVQSLPRSCP